MGPDGGWLVRGGIPGRAAGALLLLAVCASPAAAQHADRVGRVAEMAGLVAFWDFSTTQPDGAWASHHDPAVVDRSFPAYLKRIGDPARYTLADWPHADDSSRVVVDRTGPFGHAVRFNRGYVFGEVPRAGFDGTPLDLHGRRPFTLLAWVKFTGPRHMVAGIWDEGGWDRYAGRRQAALFGGLFQQKGVIAHVSATGAASYPQSTAPGSQYARARAIDGRAFEDGEWVMMGMTYDPAGGGRVVASLNGQATPLDLVDPVAGDVYGEEADPAANPFPFPHPLYAPRSFLLKYNGYGHAADGVREHRVWIDLDARTLRYGRDADETALAGAEFRITFDVLRDGASVPGTALTVAAEEGRVVRIPGEVPFRYGDVVRSALERREGGAWRRVGTVVERSLREGAPFTFGRALGLGSEELSHGSELFVDGVAVFDRVLTPEELRSIAFVE